MSQDITATLEERGQRYGKFSSHAATTQALKRLVMLHTPTVLIRNGKEGPFFAPDQQEAIDMICHKLGQILNGDPDYSDSWHDIAGYAQLVAMRLNGVER